MTKHLFFFFFIFLLNLTTSFSQIISADMSANSNDFLFTPSFIKNNNIQRITGILSTKKDGDKIRPKNEKEVWAFNSNGYIIIEAKYFPSKNGEDSLLTQYSYNLNSLLLCKTTFDYNGVSSLCLEYIENEMPVKEIYSKLEFLIDTITNEKEKINHLISSEEFKYMTNGNQLIKKFFNSYGKEYKQEKKIIDNLGYLQEISITYTINNYTTNYIYTYNQNGFLEKKNMSDNLDKNNTTQYHYKYDEKNNITEIYTFKNKNLVSEKQFVYNSKNYFLEAMIVKDASTNFIRIIKYSYK